MNDELLASWTPTAGCSTDANAECYVLTLELTAEQCAAIERVLEPESRARVLRLTVSAADRLAGVVIGTQRSA